MRLGSTHKTREKRRAVHSHRTARPSCRPHCQALPAARTHTIKMSDQGPSRCIVSVSRMVALPRTCVAKRSSPLHDTLQLPGSSSSEGIQYSSRSRSSRCITTSRPQCSSCLNMMNPTRVVSDPLLVCINRFPPFSSSRFLLHVVPGWFP